MHLQSRKPKLKFHCSTWYHPRTIHASPNGLDNTPSGSKSQKEKRKSRHFSFVVVIQHTNSRSCHVCPEKTAKKNWALFLEGDLKYLIDWHRFFMPEIKRHKLLWWMRLWTLHLELSRYTGCFVYRCGTRSIADFDLPRNFHQSNTKGIPNYLERTTTLCNLQSEASEDSELIKNICETH